MNGYLAGGLVFGAVCIAVYMIRERRGHPDLGTVLVLLISGVGVATGIQLIQICATKHNLTPFSEEDRVYIIAGGIALMWISGEAILRAYRASAGSGGSN